MKNFWGKKCVILILLGEVGFSDFFYFAKANLAVTQTRLDTVTDAAYFFPIVFHFSAKKNCQKLLFPRPSSLFPISITITLRTTLTYPSTLGGGNLNSAAHFMTYPKL